MTNPRSIPLFAFLAAFLTLFAGCSVATNHYVKEGADENRSFSTVAGNIRVGANASIRDAKTVAGNIDVRSGSRTGSLNTVAGEIWVGEGAQVRGSVKTVAGNVEVAPGATISGSVNTVAGNVTLKESEVSGDVKIVAGELRVLASKVRGDVVVSKSSKNSGEALVDIGEGSQVGGIVVKRSANVRLRIHSSATVGMIEGVEAEYY
ncbi:hypothetical protein [Pelagicoccus mobilis]|uniref:Polymer-forming cytoskeletal protein n=1 Tax=Pelagicoccus mobilis TaxID=415221 RepID=A0A934S628_9BACT|nr:hypothetical protein [Pelagicoccus mobilis]MBK1879618.1 hypothetical protein [Pelagicoccus mobilis]